MIADHITQATTPPSARTAAASLAAFLDEYPQLDVSAMHWDVRPNGSVDVVVNYLTPESGRLVSEMAQALHSKVREQSVETTKGDAVRAFTTDAVFDGTRWYVRGYLPADAFAYYTRTHNPDPQEWTEAERAEYTALAGQAVAA